MLLSSMRSYRPDSDVGVPSRRYRFARNGCRSHAGGVASDLALICQHAVRILLYGGAEPGKGQDPEGKHTIPRHFEASRAVGSCTLYLCPVWDPASGWKNSIKEFLNLQMLVDLVRLSELLHGCSSVHDGVQSWGSAMFERLCPAYICQHCD